MRNKLPLLVIIIALFLMIFFLTKVLAGPKQTMPNYIPNETQQKIVPSERSTNPNSDSGQQPAYGSGGYWYGPMSPNYQPKYDWYHGPSNNWNQRGGEWWCW